MLSIHILNAGHGDSIILEYDGGNGPVFGVIDSNREARQLPPALKKLRQLGAEKLSFVALTHPHADHYRGLLEILEEYRGRIDNFYSFPLDHNKEGRLKKLSKIYVDIHNKTDGLTSRAAICEYLSIIYEVKEHIGLENWEEHTGIESAIAPVGFKGVDIQAILPLRSVKGDYFQLIENESSDVVENMNLNALSLAYKLSYNGHEIVLGGDVPYKYWMEHKRQNERRGIELDATLVKLPHHGSRRDCDQDVIKYLFTPNGQRYACISANGRTHPHEDTLSELERLNIMPYCTNLAIGCGEVAKKVGVYDSSIDASLVLYLNRVLEEIPGQRVQPCQGNITTTIDGAGNLSIEAEHALPCTYRGDYAFIGM